MALTLAQELAGIRKRATAKGRKPTAAAVAATYRRDLARRKAGPGGTVPMAKASAAAPSYRALAPARAAAAGSRATRSPGPGGPRRGPLFTPRPLPPTRPTRSKPPVQGGGRPRPVPMAPQRPVPAAVVPLRGRGVPAPFGMRAPAPPQIRPRPSLPIPRGVVRRPPPGIRPTPLTPLRGGSALPRPQDIAPVGRKRIQPPKGTR